jgi:hypothetical protein
MQNLCFQIENNEDNMFVYISNGDFGAGMTSYHACVDGAIFFAVSFLEANINELFADALDYKESKIIHHLSDDTRLRLGAMWQKDNFRKYESILKKYQMALKLNNKKRFEEGQPPYNEVKLVVDLRNAMVHYKPEWVTTVSTITKYPVTLLEFEKKLKSIKFPQNPFANEWEPFFPNKCLGHGCAKWAVDSCIKFADEFYLRMCIDPPPYEHIREQFKLL